MSISTPLVGLPLPTGFPVGFVGRERLLRRLSAPVPVALVVAPAGHGKTTTVAQWAERDERRTSWVTCTDDTDVRALLADVPQPWSLVLDDFERVTDPRVIEAVAELSDRVPPGSRLTILSRREPALALGRLRVRRRIVELRREHLALTAGEACAALKLLGVDADADTVAALVRRTEGWPAAVDLAGLTAADAPDPVAVLRRFSGDDHRFAEYVHDEVLAGIGDAHLDFLVRTSVLDRLTGALCDAVVDRSDSGRVLRLLAAETGLLVPLDPADRWYRHHRLFAEALRARLALGDRAVARAGHARAGRWYAEEGDVESAVVHAAAAGDAGAAGDLLFDSVASYVDATGGDSVHRWIDRFSSADVRRSPALSLAAARSAWTQGELDRAEHLGRLAGAVTAGAETDARRGELRAATLVVRASVARDGIASMARDAAEAAGALPDHSGWTCRARLLEGIALHLLGRRAEAEERLRDGARRAAIGTPDVRALCLAQLALAADERGAHDDAAILAARARAHVDAPARTRCPTDAIVLAISAMTLAERGVVDEASSAVREATALLQRLTDFVPWYEAEARVALARAELRLSNVVSAKEHLHEAGRVLRPTPDAPALRAWIEDAWARTDAYCAAAVVAPALTMAELRVLRLLPTHLSFGEIAERLFVSANTIKTQAHAVYRKLDASSRSGAVARGRELGLIDA